MTTPRSRWSSFFKPGDPHLSRANSLLKRQSHRHRSVLSIYETRSAECFFHSVTTSGIFAVQFLIFDAHAKISREPGISLCLSPFGLSHGLNFHCQIHNCPISTDHYLVKRSRLNLGMDCTVICKAWPRDGRHLLSACSDLRSPGCVNRLLDIGTRRIGQNHPRLLPSGGPRGSTP
jgi:hypothetical protein